MARKQKIQLWHVEYIVPNEHELGKTSIQYFYATNHRDTALEHAAEHGRKIGAAKESYPNEAGFIQVYKELLKQTDPSQNLKYGGAVICAGGIEEVAMR